MKQTLFDKHKNKIYISIQYKKSLTEEYWGIQGNKIKEEERKYIVPWYL